MRIVNRCRKVALAWVLLASVFCSPSYAADAVPELPRHLLIARELAENIKPANNHYSLGVQSISFPGDVFSSDYVMRADCSGLLLALIERAHYPVRTQLAFLNWTPSRKRPVAEDFVFSIETGKGFQQIIDVRLIRPGDVLAHAMLNASDKSQTGTTGHVMLVDSEAKKIEPRNPLVAGTEQYEVAIIDSNIEYLGSDDTRLADPSNKITGLGRGTIRLYADTDGALVGWARNFKNTNRFFSYSTRFPSDTKERKAAIGRLITQ